MKNRIIKRSFLIILYIIIFKYKFYCQINDDFYGGTLEESGSSILDISDYLNLSLIISTSGKIYNGIPFSERVTTNANLNASSSAAVCNQNYVLVACLQDSLLTKININNGNFISLIEYSEFNSIEVSSKSSCCISIYENIVVIGISQPYSGDKIKNAIIRINIENKDNLINGPSISNNEKKLFNFPIEHKKTGTTRDILCEFIVEQNTNEYRFLCIYENITDSDNQIKAVSINNNMEGFEKEIMPF